MPWSTVLFVQSAPPEEISLSKGWRWSTNWRVKIDRTVADREGWTYATKLSRFQDEERQLKNEKSWNDKVRRRLYVRLMMQVGDDQSDKEIVEGIRNGLKSIQRSRARLQQMLLTSPDLINDDEILSLIDTVLENICDILSQIEIIILNPGMDTPYLAEVANLKMDVQKEQLALKSALERVQTTIIILIL